jgi:hypothetical protein
MLKEEGIIPRAISALFSSIDVSTTVYCSFIQIYNEKVYDLLKSNSLANAIELREDNENNMHMEGVTEYIIKSKKDCLRLLFRGERNRY